MPLCDFRCQSCSCVVSDLVSTTEFPIGTAHPRLCPNCDSGTLLRAITTVQTNGTHPKTRFQPHHNLALGENVSTMREFDDGLKRKAEAQSEYLGIDHEYVRVDAGDKSAFGVTDEGDYEGEKRQHELGNREPVRSFWV